MKRRVLAFASVVTASLCGGASAQQGYQWPVEGPQPVAGNSIDLPHAWPGRDGVTQLIDNDRGTMWEVVFPKNVPSQWHRHLYHFVGVDLEASVIAVTNPNGARNISPTTKDRMWILPKYLTHNEEGLSNVGRHMLIIDIKESPAPVYQNDAGLEEGYTGANATLVNDHEFVLQWDVNLTPEVEEAATFHSRDIFVGVLEGGQLSITEGDKEPDVRAIERGDAFFLKGGVARTIASAEGNIRLMLVEMK